MSIEKLTKEGLLFRKEEVMPLLGMIKESLSDGEANPFCGLNGRYIDFTYEFSFVSLFKKKLIRMYRGGKKILKKREECG